MLTDVCVCGGEHVKQPCLGILTSVPQCLHDKTKNQNDRGYIQNAIFWQDVWYMSLPAYIDDFFLTCIFEAF